MISGGNLQMGLIETAILGCGWAMDAAAAAMADSMI